MKAQRSDDANAFLPVTGDSSIGFDAEFLGEDFIGSATAGESQSETMRDEISDDEDGGPYIVLGEDGSLPPESIEASDLEGYDENAQHEHNMRGANWAARGA